MDTIMQPMSTARNLDDMLAGTTMTLYEVLRRDQKNATDMWRRVGLEKEFRKKFRIDASFWNSDQSLFDIYRSLKQGQEGSK